MMKNSNIAIIITAAGSSTRMGCKTKKEYLSLGEGTVLSTCVQIFYSTFLKSPNLNLSSIIITIPQNGLNAAQNALKSVLNIPELQNKIQFVYGDSTRQKSVFNGIKALNQNELKPDYVLIHDGARPFVTPEIISSVIENTIKNGAAAPGITPTDTQKEIDENGFIIRHLIRKNLTAIQTPQGFEFTKLHLAHEKAADSDYEYTDDTEIWGQYCGPVKVVSGSPSNIKITYPGDLEKGKSND